MKYFLLISLTIFSLSSSGQLTVVEPNAMKDQTLSEVKHKKEESLILKRYVSKSNAKTDTLYTVIIDRRNYPTGFIYFKDDLDTIEELCNQFKKHLNAPKNTNTTFDLGNTRITLRSDRDKKGRRGVQIISDKGIITLWESEAEIFFCISKR